MLPNPEAVIKRLIRTVKRAGTVITSFVLGAVVIGLGIGGLMLASLLGTVAVVGLVGYVIYLVIFDPDEPDA